MKVFIYSLIIFALVIVGCSRSDAINRLIPFVAIMSNLSKYDGSMVHVITYATLKFEGQAAYIVAMDAESLIFSNGLWLDVPGELIDDLSNHGHVGVYEIWGRIDVSKHGHFELWPGTIQFSNITEYLLIEN